MTGIDAFLEILAKAGVRYLFGNPGTTELPLNDALARDDRFKYILGLHEIPLTAMAEGYAMASGHVGVCNLHTACGLGNAMGMLYNAYRAGSPVLFTAGQQDQRLMLHEPVLEGDLVRVARPWTKWAYEVRSAADLPQAVRRAVQVARTPPTGPVFLSLPLDVQIQPVGALDLTGPCLPDPRVRPPLPALEQAAQLLLAAKNPVILAGSRVTETGGCAALAELAETLGAPVYSECNTSHGRLPIAAHHPLYRGALPLWSNNVHDLLAPYDVAFCVGLNVLRLYIQREPERPLPSHLRLIHLDHQPWEIAKNFPVDVGLLGDPHTGLLELTMTLQKHAPKLRAQSRERIAASGAIRDQERAELLQRAHDERKRRPLTPLTLMHTLAQVLPGDGVVVEEAVTTHQNILERLSVFRDPTGHFGHRGWALGWGLGCALGVKLAWPERPVVGLLGDGAALYGIQGLWTAAKYRLAVPFVIANNAQYKILKVCGDLLPLPEMAKGHYVGLDLTEPAVDFVRIAEAFGVEAHRVTTPDDLRLELERGLSSDRPVLIDVPIEG